MCKAVQLERLASAPQIFGSKCRFVQQILLRANFAKLFILSMTCPETLLNFQCCMESL